MSSIELWILLISSKLQKNKIALQANAKPSQQLRDFCNYWNHSTWSPQMLLGVWGSASNSLRIIYPFLEKRGVSSAMSSIELWILLISSKIMEKQKWIASQCVTIKAIARLLQPLKPFYMVSTNVKGCLGFSLKISQRNLSFFSEESGWAQPWAQLSSRFSSKAPKLW